MSEVFQIGGITTPPPEPTSPVVPVAAVVAIVIGTFVFLIVLLLLIRKCLQNRGIEGPQCIPVHCHDYCECGDSCKGMAEKLDCRTPDCQAWLDGICPTKQQCGVLCGQVWSCYCCYIMADSCKDVNLCPDCGACQCPDCDCCECCHCTLKPPECSHITCLCFECGRPDA